jgi:hypothetical protein
LLVSVFQQDLPSLLKDTGLTPLSIDPVNGRSWHICLARQGVTLAADARHINNGVKDQAQGSGFATTRAGRFFWPNQRRNQTPLFSIERCFNKESLCFQDLLVIFRIGA